MSYPGNQAISPEVQQRIRSTFAQTLGLAEQGQSQQAALGCDFILQLDPEYRPAQALQQRLGSEDDGGVDVEDLRAQLEGRPSAEEREAEAQALFEETRPGLTDPTLAAGTGAPGGDETVLVDSLADAEEALSREAEDDPFALDDLPDLPGTDEDEDILGLPDLEPFSTDDPAVEPAAGPETDPADTPPEISRQGATGELPLPDLDAFEAEDTDPVADPPVSGDLGQRLRTALDERRFADAVELAHQHSDTVAADPELARLANQAVERQEAAPYVERFVEAAARAREKGDLDEAATLTEKARALDPSHPTLTTGGDEATVLAAAPALDGGEAAAPPEPAQPTQPTDEVTEPGLELDDFAFGGGDEEGDRRIAELLEDGQGAYDRGDYQGAIDAWSRIFLIDIDHDEASQRIEEARRLKNEEDRQVEEIYHEAVQAAGEGRDAEAREGFETVLRVSPGYGDAREHLDRLGSGEAPPPTPPPNPGAGAPDATSSGEATSDDELLREQIMIPPDPGQEGAEAAVEGGVEGPKGRTMVARGGVGSRRFQVIAGLVLLAVLAAAFVLYQQRDVLFPNAGEPAAEAPQAMDPVERATRLHENGRTPMAIQMLRRLPPTAPRYEEAQALISQWQAETEPDEEVEVAPVPEPEGPKPEDLVVEARAAADAGEYLRARDLLAEARTVRELSAEATNLDAEITTALAPYSSAMSLIAQGEYTRALPDLWRRHERNPENQDIRRLISDSYYNLAIRALQQGDAETAADHLEEAAAMTPGEDMQRHLRFARTYAQRNKDLLYRIYVKYLPAR